MCAYFFILEGYRDFLQNTRLVFYSLMTASIFLIVALARERHIAVCSPHEYRIKMKTITTFRHLAPYLFFVFFWSIVLSGPYEFERNVRFFSCLEY